MIPMLSIEANATFDRPAFSGGNSSSWNTTASQNFTNVPANCSFSIQRPPINYTFPYIIPYGTPQACNIYGPACQTGSIAVGVSLSGCRSTITTMPCSEYLSSQRSYLKAFSTTPDPHALAQAAMGPGVIPVVRPPAHDGVLPSDWNLNFGRSPECRAYAQREEQGGQWNFEGCPAGRDVEPVRLPPVTSMNFNQQPAWGSTCDRQFSAWALLPTQLPPGIIQYKADYNCQTCCGNCTIDVPEFRLYYFEDENAEDYCTSKGRRALGIDSTANATKGGNFSGQANLYDLAFRSLGSATYNRSLGNRFPQRIVSSAPLRGSLVTTRGHTLTSPSIYMEVVGTMAVHDQCGPLGQNKSGVFIAVPPGQLSTSKVDLIPHIRDVGSEWLDPSFYGQGFFAPENVQPFVAADMNCPTFGLGVSTNDQGVVRTTIGSPWLPLIVPPSQALSLDPTWHKYCTGILSYSQNLASFGIFDPPHALIPDPAGGLVSPSESQPTPAADPEQTRIVPGQTPMAATPSATPLWDAPGRLIDFAAKAKVPAVGLLPPKSKISKAAPSQAGAAAPASRQDTTPRDSAKPVQSSSNDRSLAGGQLGNPPNPSPSSSGDNPGDASSNTEQDGSHTNDLNSSQRPSDTMQGHGGTGPASLNGNVYPQQHHDPAAIPVKNPSADPNRAKPVDQGAGSPYSPSSDDHGASLPAGVEGDSPGSSVNGEGPNRDVDPVQQGNQGVKQPTEGSQQGFQGTVSQGSSGQGAAPQSPSNKGTDNQITSAQNGKNEQIGSATEAEGGPPAIDPVNGQGSNQVESPDLEVDQGVGQQDPGAQANAQGITPQGTNGDEAVPQRSSSDGPIQEASNGQVITPQDSSGSNGQGASSEGSGSLANQASEGQVTLPQGPSASSDQEMTPQGSQGDIDEGLGTQAKHLPVGGQADNIPSAQAVTIAGQTFSPDPNGFEVAGQAVEPGGPGVLVSGTPVSLAPSGTLIIGGSTISLSNPAPQVQPLKVGGESFVPKPQGFNVGGKVVQPGGPPVIIAGTPVSLAPSGTLHVGDSTFQLVQAVPTQAAQHRQLPNVGGQSFVPDPTGFVVAGQSVKPGGPAVNIAGTPISLAQNSALFVGGSSFPLNGPDVGPVTSATPQNVVNIGGETVVAFPTGFAIPSGSSIIPDAAPVTVASTPVSLGSDGVLHLGTSAIPLSPPSRQSLTEEGAKTFNVGSLTFTPFAPFATSVVVEGTTILPNSLPHTFHGTNVSLDAENGLFVNGTRTLIPIGANNNIFTAGKLTITITAPPAGVAVDGIRILPGETALNIKGQNITVDASGGLAVGDIAVPIPRYSSDGSVLNVGNLTFSALSQGGGLVVDGMTILPNAPAKIVQGVGVKLDVGGNLVVGNVTVTVPTGLAAATGNGNTVESTGGAAWSGGNTTGNSATSTSAATTPRGGSEPTGGPSDDGKHDDGNAAPVLRLSWMWMVVASLFGNAAVFFMM